MRSRPPSFLLAGLCTAFFGAAMLGTLIRMDSGEPGAFLARGAAALLAALAAVATEAFWRARQWAYSATLALALSLTLSAIAVAMRARGVPSFPFVFGYMAAATVIAFPLLAALRHRPTAVRAGWRRRPVASAPSVPHP